MQTRAKSIPRAPVVELPVRGCQYHGGRRGEDGFLIFCGKPVKQGYSYCPAHYRRIYQRTQSLRELRALAAEAAPEPAEAVPLPELEREAA